MSDLKISELPALSGADLASGDQLAVVDSSASQTSKLTVNDLIANGVTLISDDTIPGAKILFAAGDVPGTALADSAVTTAKIADDAVTAAKLADNSSVELVTTLPASGAFTGQLALDTDDNSLYAWDGSAWQNVAAPSSIAGSTVGEINIVVTTSGTTTTISATIDDTTSAAQFLAGPTGSAGTVGYRTIVSTDLPTATSSAKGAVIVNGDGLALTGDTIGIDNTVSASSTHHVVTYDVNGLITGGRAIAAADLPIATSSAVGGVIASDGLTVDVTGNLSIDNTVTAGTYTKVTVTNKGVVSAGDTLVAADIPDHSADKLTSGTIGTSLIANDAITADKIGDQATTKFGGAAGSDNVTIFPTGDYKGQFFYDETTQDLYIYTGSAFVPITVLSGNLVNAGAYNASTNQMSSVTSAGSSAGFSVGNALPAPAKTNLNHYVVVDTSGTGTGAAPAVALAPPDMLLSQGVGTEYSLIDVSNAIAGQTASNISLIATGDITATDVQAGITELDNEKLPKAGGTMTGNLELNNANVVFEGSSADDYETTLTVTNPTADRTITLPNVTGTVVTTGDTGSVTSTMITDGTIINADINASAEIAVSKLANGTARQLLETAADGTSVQFASNIDIPGTLDVTGAATFDSTVTAVGLISANGKISFPAGTASAPSLYSGTDTDTGIYAPGADQFGISTGGTPRVVVDSSGNVGIGATSVDRHFHVEGTDNVQGKFQNNGSLCLIEFEDASTTAGNRPSFGSVGNEAVVHAAGSERMRIDSSGNVGIGTTGPNHKLHINDSGANNVFTQYTNSATGSGLGDGSLVGVTSTGSLLIAQKEANTIDFHTSNTERMRIDSSGRLLVGTSSNIRSSKLQVLSTGNDHMSLVGGNQIGQLELCRSSNSAGGAGLVADGDIIARIECLANDGSSYRSAARIQAAVDGTPGANDMPGRLVFSTTADGASSSTERMRISSNGKVDISTNDLTVYGITVGRGAGSVSSNTAVGNGALAANTTGSNNTANGYQALYSNTTGYINTASGAYALYTNTTGYSNVANGYYALYSNTTGSNNTANGRSALRFNTTGIQNTANGDQALYTNTTGNYNVANGYYALHSNTTGYSNTANGRSALRFNTTGNNNTANGLQALYSNTTGSNNVANGLSALYYNTTGSGNFGAAFRNSSGNYAPVFDPTTHNNRVVMGHTSVTNAYVQVAWTVVSDARDKMNFAPVPHGLDFINQLQPTAYQFKVDRDTEEPNGPVRYGFKAQDILALEGDNPVIIDTEDEDRLKYKGEHLVPILVNAVQELSAENAALKARLDAAGI